MAVPVLPSEFPESVPALPSSVCPDDGFDERRQAHFRPGRYIVAVRRTAKNGIAATAQLKVVVE